MATVSSHRAKLAGYSAGSPAPLALLLCGIDCTYNSQITIFLPSIISKIAPTIFMSCAIELEHYFLSRPKYLMYVISEEGMSTHTPAAPSWVLLQNIDAFGNIAADGSHFRFIARVL